MSEMETAVYFWGSRMQKTGWGGERGVRIIAERFHVERA